MGNKSLGRTFIRALGNENQAKKKFPTIVCCIVLFLNHSVPFCCFSFFFLLFLISIHIHRTSHLTSYHTSHFTSHHISTHIISFHTHLISHLILFLIILISSHMSYHIWLHISTYLFISHLTSHFTSHNSFHISCFYCILFNISHFISHPISSHNYFSSIQLLHLSILKSNWNSIFGFLQNCTGNISTPCGIFASFDCVSFCFGKYATSHDFQTQSVSQTQPHPQAQLQSHNQYH